MKTVSGQSIQKYINQTNKTLRNLDEDILTEETTKHFLIQPFLKIILDWPTNTPDTKYILLNEYQTRIGSSNKFVDYALLDSNQTPLCFIEVKRAKTPLKKRDKEQLTSYMKNEAVTYGILTNGKEFCFYIRDNQNTLQEIEVSHITYSNLSQIQDLLNLYYYPNIKNKENENARTEIFERYRRKKQFDPETAKTSIKDILNPQNQKEEQLIDTFIKDYQQLINTLNFKPQATDINPSRGNNESIKDLIEKETSVQFKNGEPILDEKKTATEQLVNIVGVLLEHDIIAEDNLPLKRGRKRYLINYEPVDSEGEEMKGPKPLKDGLYVETNYSTQDCTDIIQELAKKEF